MKPLRLSRQIFLLSTGFVFALLALMVCSSKGNQTESAAGSRNSVTAAASDSENKRATVNEDLFSSRQNAITRAIAEVSPAVVGINVIQVQRYYQRNPFADDPFFRQFFKDVPVEKRVKSLGSGFIISKEGHILTNQHVINDATEIIVTRVGGKQYVARKIGEDFVTDVAILKIEGNDFPYARLGDSDDVIIGEWAIALGNPFGLFDLGSKPTVTVGVISAKDQDFGRQNNERIFEDMLQTDAAINGGNSGGPLANCNGEVIGINTYILSSSGANIGLGFALPVNRVKRILNDLINYGKVDRTWRTGITYEAMSPLVARHLGLKSSHGVIVSALDASSAAAQAGLQVGDVIMGINGREVENFEDVQAIIDDLDLKKGDLLQFRIYRERRFIIIPIELQTSERRSRGRTS